MMLLMRGLVHIVVIYFSPVPMGTGIWPQMVHLVLKERQASARIRRATSTGAQELLAYGSFPRSGALIWTPNSRALNIKTRRKGTPKF